MKKIVPLLFIAFSFQFIASQSVTYGVKTGVNYSGFNVSNQERGLLDYKYRLGFNLGGFAKIEIQERFFIQPELLFSFQGSSTGETDVNITDFQGEGFLLKVKSDINLYYLNVPVMGKYYVNEKFSLEFGPQFGYMIKGQMVNKVQNREDLPQDLIDELVDQKSDIEGTNNFDVGLNVGLGYEIMDALELGLRYNYGFIKIIGQGSPYKNSVFQLNLAYNFK